MGTGNEGIAQVRCTGELLSGDGREILWQWFRSAYLELVRCVADVRFTPTLQGRVGVCGCVVRRVSV